MVWPLSSTISPINHSHTRSLILLHKKGVVEIVTVVGFLGGVGFHFVEICSMYLNVVVVVFVFVAAVVDVVFAAVVGVGVVAVSVGVDVGAGVAVPMRPEWAECPCL